MNWVSFFAQSNYLVINKLITQRVGLLPSIMLSELCEEYDYYDKQNKLEDGWFFSTIDNVQANTTLSKYEQTTSIKKLIELNIIEQENRGVPPKRYFKINEEVLKNLIDTDDFQKLKNLTFKSQKTEHLKVKKPDTNNNNINNNINNNLISKDISKSDDLHNTSVKEDTVISVKESTDKNTVNENSKSYKVLVEYINNMKVSDAIKKELLNWYDNVSKGRVSVKQLGIKLNDIFEQANNNEDIIFTAIHNAYINGWFGFYLPKTNNNNKSNKSSNFKIGSKKEDFIEF